MAGGRLEGFAYTGSGGRRALRIRQALTVAIVVGLALLYRLSGADGTHEAALSAFLLPVVIPLVPLQRLGLAKERRSRVRAAYEFVPQT
ncbi:MAG: hypothetical protein WCB51_01830 [Candidatus Dormiibacterota bacterium]